MKELVFVNNNNEVVTDSLMVAEVFGKKHHHVLDSIKELLEKSKNGKTNFRFSSYRSGNRNYPKYDLTKDGFVLLVMGFNGEKAFEFKEMYMEEFNRMETHIKNNQLKLPTTYLEAMKECVRLEETRLQLETKIEEDRPKVEYHDRVLESESTYTATQIANEFQMSAIKLNRLLINLGVLRRVSGQLVLRAKYQGEDYTDTKTYEFNEGRTSQQLRWTERGRAFIHTLLKGTGLGIL